MKRRSVLKELQENDFAQWGHQRRMISEGEEDDENECSVVTWVWIQVKSDEVKVR